MGIFSLATELSSSAHRRLGGLLIKVKWGKLWNALLKASLWERWPWESSWERGRGDPTKGQGGVGGGTQGYPRREGTGETLGKGWEMGKVSQGCPQTGKVHKRPQGGAGRGTGVSQGSPHTGRVQKRPTNGQNAGKSHQRGPLIGKRAERTHVGSGRWRGWWVSPPMGEGAGMTPGRRSVPWPPGKGGGDSDKPPPSSNLCHPKGAQAPHAGGAGKNINKQKRREAPSGHRGRSGTEKTGDKS